VRLRSSHPFRRPEINFRSFPQAPDDDDLEGKDPDLEALYEATKFVEGILERGRSSGTIESFSLQGIEEFDGDVRRWIKHIAWGHHACGTCRIGAEDDPGAVLDSRFRVRGVERLRVVDASVFPRIPGYFIVTNVYMIAEKAADVLTEDQFRSEDLAPEVVKALNYDPVFPSRPEFEDRVLYPISMEQREAEIILRRRAVAGLENEGEAGDARQPEEITL
jgi:choline dehydrogenase